MPTRNVNLTKRLDEFVESNIASGHFSNASEVVREGLRMLEQRQKEEAAKLAWLRGAVQEGIDDIEKGNYTVLETDEDLDNFMNEIWEDVQRKQRRKAKRVA